MTRDSDADSRRVERDLDAWAQDLERHWGFPSGALKQGRITHFASDARLAVWTARGGVVACPEEAIAADIAAAIAEHRNKDYRALLARLEEVVRSYVSATSCELNVGLYCYGAPVHVNERWRDAIHVMTPEERWPGEEHMPGMEHIFVIKEGSVIISQATNRLALEVGGHWLYAIGAGTHPEYRNRGLAKAVVSALLAHIAVEGGAALWNCDVLNVPSLRLARSVGFTEYLWKFDWNVSEEEMKVRRAVMTATGGGSGE